MGRSFFKKHIGAYFKFEMTQEEFEDILIRMAFYRDEEESVFKDFNYEKFKSSDEGLEGMGILLPYNKDEDCSVCEEFDEDDYDTVLEYEPENYDFETFAENLKISYSKEIEAIQTIFGDKMIIKTGLVLYADEVA